MVLYACVVLNYYKCWEETTAGWEEQAASWDEQS
jgi:hypothetical protein